MPLGFRSSWWPVARLMGGGHSLLFLPPHEPSPPTTNHQPPFPPAVFLILFLEHVLIQVLTAYNFDEIDNGIHQDSRLAATDSITKCIGHPFNLSPFLSPLSHASLRRDGQLITTTLQLLLGILASRTNTVGDSLTSTWSAHTCAAMQHVREDSLVDVHIELQKEKPSFVQHGTTNFANVFEFARKVSLSNNDEAPTASTTSSCGQMRRTQTARRALNSDER